MNILRHFSGRIFACLMLVAFAAGAFSAFGRVSLPVTTVNGRPCFYYTPRSSSETVYGLSKRLGLTREEIVAYNPGAADGLRKNTTLYFPVDDFRDRIEVEAEGSDAVVPEQTDNNRLRPVHIEYTIDSTSVVNEAEAQGELPVAPEPSGADSAMVRGEVSPYSIAVLLPFGLGEEQISRPARLATDFYKGFLIAADTLAHRGETVAVTAVDIASGSLDEALGREEVRSAAVIVAPDSPGFISRALKAGVKGYIVNTLDFADSLYLTEPRVVQTNIDHRNMYAKAVGYLISELKDATPVIISNTEGRNDKEAFTAYLRGRLTEEGVPFIEIPYEGTLTSLDLERLSVNTEASYVIVPSSGSIGEFNRFSHALNNFRVTNPDTGMRLFGYPEWVTFRGDAQDMLHTLGASIYSRFNDDFDSFSARNIASDFLRWYGEPMIESIPSRGLLGYDLGCMLVKNLRANHGVFSPETPAEYRGIQSTFRLVRASDAEDSGYVNDALYIIHYLPVTGTDCTIH